MLPTLIVDDDGQKIGRLISILKRHGVTDDEIHRAPDLLTAARLLEQHQFVLMIVDLNLPNRHGDSPGAGSGIDFLDEVRNFSYLRKPYHVIGFTAFEEMHKKHRPYFEQNLWHILQYAPDDNAWQTAFEAMVQYLVGCDFNGSSIVDSSYDYDIAIVCALHQPELASVLRLPASWTELNIPRDGTVYHTTYFVEGTKRLKVVAAAANQMGMPAAAALTMKMIGHFRPRYLLMPGIAAGVEGKCNIGDILVAELAWDYGSGKISVGEEGLANFLPETRQLSISSELRDRLLTLKAQRRFLDDIRNSWPAQLPSGALDIHVGPVASGASVIEYQQIVQGITDVNRKLIGIEMEAYGMYLAADNCLNPRPSFLAMKSVCDFANVRKNNEFQSYAAYTSANFLYRFALSSL